MYADCYHCHQQYAKTQTQQTCEQRTAKEVMDIKQADHFRHRDR